MFRTNQQTRPHSGAGASRVCHVCGGAFPAAALAPHQARCIRSAVKASGSNSSLAASSSGQQSHHASSTSLSSTSSKPSLAASLRARLLARGGRAQAGGSNPGSVERLPDEPPEPPQKATSLRKPARRSLNDVPAPAYRDDYDNNDDDGGRHYDDRSRRAANPPAARPREQRQLERAPAAAAATTKEPARRQNRDPANVVIPSRMEVAKPGRYDPDNYGHADDDDGGDDRRYARRGNAGGRQQQQVYQSADSFGDDDGGSIEEEHGEYGYDDDDGDDGEDGGAADVDRVPCRHCGRRFASDRLDKHATACARLKKRKVFDMTKARVRGTELEQYAMRKDKEPSKPVKKSNWRAKHENFIRMVRANRDAGAAAAAGGPPPPFVPSDPDPDYILCDHCGRRFSPVAADRHIPICANTKNRPRPAPAARSSGAIAAGGSGSAGAAAEAMKRRVGYKPPLPAAPAAPAAKKAGQTGSRGNLAASPARRR